jgi:DNA-binding response OmpR family regulator
LHHIDDARLTEIVEKELAHLQRPNRDAAVAFGDVTVDFVTMEAFRKNEPVALTTLQFKTLRYLTRHARRVISRDELLNEVWGYEHYPTTRTVDNVILKLRQQLESNPSRPVHLRTIHGAGYQFLP